jgi:hypothetical protein
MKCLVINLFFYGEGLLVPRQIPKLENHPMSAVHGCLFNVFTANVQAGSRPSIRDSRTRHSVVTRTHLTWFFSVFPKFISQEKLMADSQLSISVKI